MPAFNATAPHGETCRPDATWLYALLTVWLLIGVVLFGRLPAEWQLLWMEESGPIEMLSVIGYFVCASIAICWFGQGLRTQWYLPVMVIGMGLRELDFHTRFTTMGVFKLRFYSSGTVPLGEKLIVTLVLLTLFTAVGWAVWRQAGVIREAVRMRSTVLVGIVWGLALAIVAKLADGLPRKLDVFDVTLPEWLVVMIGNAEEIIELGIPVMFTTALLCHIFSHPQSGPAMSAVTD